MILTHKSSNFIVLSLKLQIYLFIQNSYRNTINLFKFFANMELPNYQILQILGHGTFGKCSLAKNLITKQLCVIKQIDISGMDHNQKTQAIKQAFILESLNHQFIIKYYGAFYHNKYLNITMEYAQGGDLRKKIKNFKGHYFSENQILDWFTQIILAIKHVHDKKILHRDLKSQNIFITKNNCIKLGDFGIAKNLTQTIQKMGKIVGTPYYMAPQVCQNKGYSYKTDIWSLGVILYQMCSLKPPFQAKSLGALALKILKGDYNPIPVIYSKQMRNLVKSILHTDASKRITIQQIMNLPIIKIRLNKFMNQHRIRDVYIKNKVVKQNSDILLKNRIMSVLTPKYKNIDVNVQQNNHIDLSYNRQVQNNKRFIQNYYDANQNRENCNKIRTKKREKSSPSFSINKTSRKVMNNNTERNSKKQKQSKNNSSLNFVKIQNKINLLKNIKTKKSNVPAQKQVLKIRRDDSLNFNYERKQQLDRCLNEYEFKQVRQLNYSRNVTWFSESERQFIYKQQEKEKLDILQRKQKMKEQRQQDEQNDKNECLREYIEECIGVEKSNKILQLVELYEGFSENIELSQNQRKIFPLIVIYYELNKKCRQ